MADADKKERLAQIAKRLAQLCDVDPMYQAFLDRLGGDITRVLKSCGVDVSAMTDQQRQMCLRMNISDETWLEGRVRDAKRELDRVALAGMDPSERRLAAAVGVSPAEYRARGFGTPEPKSGNAFATLVAPLPGR
jgi:hypothetical protein